MKKNYQLFFAFVLSSFFVNTLKAQCTTTTVVPYFESFAGISATNQLPTCWAASNLANTCLTYTSPQTQGRMPHSGNEFASFHVTPLGVNYFYTSGIQLNAGVTYSASVWYTTEYYGYTNWSDLSLLLGSSQSPTGLVSLASTNGPAVSQYYTSLSGTFTVSSSGVYYMAIRATGGSTVGAQYLSFDDVKIQSVCANLNISLVTSSTVICSGAGAVSYTATSPNTHSWSTGATGTVTTFTVNPSLSGPVTVIGTNTISGCSSTASLFMTVNPSPNVLVLANPPIICTGASATLNALGTVSYTWSTGQQGNSIIVTPSLTTSYSVTGSNSLGCTSSVAQNIQVYPLPIISVSNTVPSNTICTGASDTLHAFGANSYQWAFGTSQLMGSQIIVTPTITTTYVVVGTNINNCSSQTSFVLNVSGCTSINQFSATVTEIKAVPNPFQNEFVISTGTNNLKTISITDLSGRIIFSFTSKEDEIKIHMRDYANGIYYVTITFDLKTSVLKVIKD